LAVRRRLMFALMLAAVVLLPATVTANDAHSDGSIVIYVSISSGLDTNPGTLSDPLQTLPAAQSLVRTDIANGAGDITVILEPGLYRITKPLALTAADSPSQGSVVDWVAETQGTVTISGAVRISGWTESDPTRDIWSASIPPTYDSRQLYVNGMRASIASGPSPVAFKQTSYGYIASNPTMSTWRNPTAIDFVWTGDLGPMVQSECPVASIRSRYIRMAQPCWNNSTRRHWNWVGYTRVTTPTYIENAYDLLVKPGQFYLDLPTHTLYYIPRAGQDMTTADAELPVLSSLVKGTGTVSDPVSNIAFSGIEFAYATWLGPGSNQGFAEVQAGYRITGAGGAEHEGLCKLVPHGTCPYGNWSVEPAAISLVNDHHVVFSNDEFVHLGGAGLDLGDGSQESTVAASVFTDIAGNGIEVGGVDAPLAASPAQTTGVSVTDNHIFGIGVEFPGAVGVIVGYAADTDVAHNQIDHMPYSAISIGWGGWPDKGDKPPVPNYSHNNTISDNLIFDYMETLTDGGGIYTLGLQGTSLATGEFVTGNVIHDQLGWSAALKSDNGATYVTYSRNVTYDDTYDWDGNHYDYRAHPGTKHPTSYDPQSVTDNYWQQGYPDASSRGSAANNNNIISGPGQAPLGIIRGAGIEPLYASILSWIPESTDVPDPPTTVAVLYAFGGHAWVTWRPSYSEGSGPVESYAVTACPRTLGHIDCGATGTVSTIVLDGDYESSGYVDMGGLTSGHTYAFQVSASNSAGASTPSIPSKPVKVSATPPRKPGRVSGVVPIAGTHAVRLLWYAPKGSYCPWPSYDSWSGCHSPILSYVIKSSAGTTYVSASASQLIVSNHEGRVLKVIGGLQSGQAYHFSIAAVNPSGTGRAFKSYSVVPH
jgi:hypothetical protein